MKTAWTSIGLAMIAAAIPTPSWACGPPTDTLCGIIQSFESVDVGPNQEGLALHGPLAFGNVTCTFQGDQEDVTASAYGTVFLSCDSDDEACLEGMQEAMAGALDGQFALFTTLMPWDKVKGGGGFPSFVVTQDSGAEDADSAWDYQTIQALPPDFAVKNRICRAAAELEPPVIPANVVSDSLIPNHVFDTDLPTPEPSSGLNWEGAILPERAWVEAKLPERDSEPSNAVALFIDEDPLGETPEDLDLFLDEEFAEAGCSAAGAGDPSGAAFGFMWLGVMWAMLRRREVHSR
jgi:MYXO-CTERM domain-containing protein